MKLNTFKLSLNCLTTAFVRALLSIIFLPALLTADPWYGGIGLDVLQWSEDGALDHVTYDSLDSTVGGTLLLGYRWGGYLSMELFTYHSNQAYLKDSDTDYLEYFMVGLGPRVNLLDSRRYSWTPWFSWYATYHSIDRSRPPGCCDDYPKKIHTVMRGTGSSASMGLDISVAENVVLQLAVRDSSVWAGWDDPSMTDTQSTMKEYIVAVHFSPGAP